MPALGTSHGTPTELRTLPSNGPSSHKYRASSTDPGDESVTADVLRIDSQDDQSLTKASTDLHEDFYPLPMPCGLPPRRLNEEESIRVKTLGRLQFFLTTAPTFWIENPLSTTFLNSFTLPNGENVSCVLWQGLYHISGTDIVRALAFRFEAFGRPVRAVKKWEEGVFSDLRNLKPGPDATLEEPKSKLLEYLFRNGCIRTQKKVCLSLVHLFSVPHDRLFLDALERDLKREKAGLTPTTVVSGEPALSFRYDPTRSLYDQFAGQNPGLGSSAADTTAQVTTIPLDICAPASHTRIGASRSESDRPRSMSRPATSLAPADSTSERLHDPRVFRGSLVPGTPDYKRRRVGKRKTADLATQIAHPCSLNRDRHVPPDPYDARAHRPWTSSPQLYPKGLNEHAGPIVVRTRIVTDPSSG
ncbi:hypothetical protein I316_00741 [Kwoniella heveanensis BCC8398]|uniref:Uncharacterized protein n=1 Tax=Kwoniella heveanensis BCC8398 TaxID=1296120 RepID=A0A1B9H2W4_9TREE|nr:hypothetical protein I316_00741 [Kwoniella heveanensis BCC8398]